MIRGLIAGIVLALAVIALAGYVGVRTGMLPANADAKPSKLERWAAHTSLRATIAREAPQGDNPVALDDAHLIAGIKLYAQNCAVCHGDSTGTPTNIANGLYQSPPQLAKDGVEDDPDGVTYWKVYHGIRLTGMPSFGHSLSEQQIWELALFLKHMDGLPAAPQRIWKAVHVST